ncbi:hypothetical protein TYRP_003203 [Tyrophagus putrescentiae]|nr:hypothetical protein TYRP_003203 [Tyrophagus putrescentiae]
MRFVSIPGVINYDPDETASFSELINSKGYLLEEYHVLTEDGYILTLHRVVPPGYDPSTYSLTRKPVLAMHGIFNDATYFYYNSPHLHSNNSYCGDNLGFCTLKSGRYDLWAANSRGNGRSTGHLRYTEKNKEFWKFSWDHMAEYDLPALIDFILARTGHRTLGYVAFSQGCAQAWAMLSLKPSYAYKMRPFINWAPAVFIGRATSLIGEPLRRLWPIGMPPGRFYPIGNQLSNSLQQWYICRTEAGAAFCSRLIDSLFGKSNVNITRIPTYANWGPNPSSNWQVAHFGQNGQAGRFRRFDYGSTGANMAKYGLPTAPDYPLKRIPNGFKAVVMYGASDAVVVPRDIQQLLGELRAAGVDVTPHLVPSSTWSHWDFMLGLNAGLYVHDDTLHYLDMYSVNDHVSLRSGAGVLTPFYTSYLGYSYL